MIICICHNMYVCNDVHLQVVPGDMYLKLQRSIHFRLFRKFEFFKSLARGTSCWRGVFKTAQRLILDINLLCNTISQSFIKNKN